MMRRLLLCVLAAGMLIGAAAPAAGAFTYTFNLNGPNNPEGSEPGGYFVVNGLNPALDAQITVRHGAAPAFVTANILAGNSSYYGSYAAGIVPGDTLEVRQPMAAVLPSATYTIPAATASFALGSSSISGTSPAGFLLEVASGDAGCDQGGRARRLGRTGGAFQLDTGRTLVAGDSVTATIFSDDGNSTYYRQYVPGETPCLRVESDIIDFQAPGGAPPAKPYRVSLSGLNPAVASDVKVEHVRGGSVIESMSSPSYYLDARDAAPALPGDRFNIYRPQGAATPSFSIEIPTVTATFDPSVDRVAVNAPASDGIFSRACRQFSCPGEFGRSAPAGGAGRTVFDYGVPSGEGPKMDLLRHLLDRESNGSPGPSGDGR
jgi:hypothetical protein